MIISNEYRLNPDENEASNNIFDKVSDVEAKMNLAKKDFFLQSIASGQVEMIPEYLPYIDSNEIMSVYFYSQFNVIEEIKNDNGEIIPFKKNLFFNTLVRCCIIDSEFSEAALISISKLLLSDSIQILHMVIEESVDINGQNTTFLNELPTLIDKATTDRMKRSLMKCISSMKGLIPNIENTFLPFFLDQLQISDPEKRKLKKTAAKYAAEIIKNNPLSAFSIEVMSCMPYVKNDIELSKYCFVVLNAQIKAGNFDSFDIPQLLDMINQCENELADYALSVISTAITYSPTIFPEITHVCSIFPTIISKFQPKFIFEFIESLISKGSDYPSFFLSFLDYFADIFSTCKSSDKDYIIKSICLIILQNHLIQIGNESICEDLIDSLLFHSDATNLIIDTLMKLKYYTEDFCDALLRLSTSNDEFVSEYALHAYEIVEKQLKLDAEL